MLGHQDRAAAEHGHAEPSPKASTASSRDAGGDHLAPLQRCRCHSPLPSSKALTGPIVYRCAGAQQSVRPVARGYRESSGVRDDRRARGRPRGARYLPERGLATALYLSLASRSRCCSRARPGVGKTEAAKALAARARRAADPAAVLRGPRRRARGLRVELLAPAAAHPRGAGGDGRRARSCSARVPDPAAAARGDRARASRSCC